VKYLRWVTGYVISDQSSIPLRDMDFIFCITESRPILKAFRTTIKLYRYKSAWTWSKSLTDIQCRAHPLSVQEEAHKYRTKLTNFVVPSNQNFCFYPYKVYEQTPTFCATTQKHSSIKLVITVPGSFLYWCNAKVCEARKEPEVHLSSNL
jgi:hypothetical protein